MKWWHYALILSFLLALVSPLSSGSPDGLEKVAEDKGFIEKANNPPFQIIADYVFPGIGNEALATILAGLLGTAFIFGAVYGIGRLVRSRQKEAAG
jgi:hypothetical protein